MIKVSQEYFLFPEGKLALLTRRETVLFGKIPDYKLMQLLLWYQLSSMNCAIAVLLPFLRENCSSISL